MLMPIEPQQGEAREAPKSRRQRASRRVWLFSSCSIFQSLQRVAQYATHQAVVTCSHGDTHAREMGPAQHSHASSWRSGWSRQGQSRPLPTPRQTQVTSVRQGPARQRTDGGILLLSSWNNTAHPKRKKFMLGFV